MNILSVARVDQSGSIYMYILSVYSYREKLWLVRAVNPRIAHPKV